MIARGCFYGKADRGEADKERATPATEKSYLRIYKSSPPFHLFQLSPTSYCHLNMHKDVDDA